MADNTTLNAGTGGDVVATDDIGGVKHQRVKVEFGADGSASDVSPTNPLPVGKAFKTRSDTFAATGNGTTVDASANPLKHFGLQVKGTGAAATAWTVVLEGSLDNANWTTILTHQNGTDADGSTKWTGTQDAPCLYVRTRCTALTLGGATNVVATLVGLQ
jgi:hypothetical protein